ncbi:hypothetical protein [Metallococcus carri]|uniref:hypothetical protein n=1 Tax=Metallococcus carri TaxID=1656884 RepID=UPI001581A990|nr:hypothetical protein [Metallococcus carri]
MAATFNLKKNLSDNKPFYAVVGAADTAVTTVRDRFDEAVSDFTARVETLRAELAPSAVQARLTETVQGVRAQVKAAPSVASNRIDEAAAEADSSYNEFVKRGRQVVKGARKQAEGYQGQAVKQVKETRSTATKRVQETQATALATFHASRKEAAKVVSGVAGQVQGDAAEIVRSEAAKEGAAKREARKAPAKKATAKKTTVKKAPARKPAATKATARKTTPRKTTAKKATTSN